MTDAKALTNRLDRAVDGARDHVLGADTAPITLVEYGSYDCPHCRAANERITEVREEFGERLRYVFRHRPVTGSDLARRAAELVEHADSPDSFWDAHVELMTRSNTLNEDDLRAVAARLNVAPDDEAGAEDAALRARLRVDEDIASARASGVQFTPTFFVNARRYDGPWDTGSFSDAILGSLGHRVRTAALGFASWAPSTGLLLLFASILAIVLTNSPLGEAFAAFWHMPFGFSLGSQALVMSLLHWVNDALLTIFFFVVGLEIKREFTVGSLSGWRQAALPIAAAIGGMVVPALFYLGVVGHGPFAIGWGVPMATDTAFAVAIIAMMGTRVPVELRVFLTAAAIVDDIGSILVVAVFYSGALQPVWLLGAGCVVAALWALNKSSVYRITPYILLGIVLWLCVQASGLHATLAGVLLAAFIPTRPPPDYKTLAAQAEIHSHRGSAPSRRALSARAFGACAESAGCDFRAAGIPRRPGVAHLGAAFELYCFADFCAGQCGRGVGRGHDWRAWDADGCDFGRARAGQTHWLSRGLLGGVAAGHCGETGELWLAATWRRGRARRNWVHHVAVHCRTIFPASGRF